MLRQPTPARIERFEAHLRNLSEGHVSLDGVGGVDDFDNHSDLEKLRIIGNMLEPLIGKPEF